MSVKNKTNKNYKRSQRGRSMVEMLGVLAIVGVLSVGGVYGYGVAMKKHKANELLHQASMLATTVSAQVMSNDGKLPETTTSFVNSSYGTFDQSVTEALDGKGFAIRIENVDSGACIQLEKMAGGMVQGASCNETTLTLTYYKNLATTEAEGEKSPTGGSEEVDPCAKCTEAQQCIGGACAEVTGECSKNADCDDWCETNGGGWKCYCSINAEIVENDSACWNNFTGVCAVAKPKSGIKDGYIASPYLNWWSAVNFCKAHNKSLVSLADLGITGGYQDDAQCEGSGCTGSFTWSDLQDKLGKALYWVTDAISCDFNTRECTSGTNHNSCHAFFVHLSSGAVTINSRNFDSCALCK